MSKAPTTKPASCKHVDEQGNKVYTYYREGVLKNGDIVYHKLTLTKPPVDPRPRKSRSDKKNMSESVYQQQKEKRKVLNLLKKTILENDDYSYIDVRNLYEKFKTPALIQAIY